MTLVSLTWVTNECIAIHDDERCLVNIIYESLHRHSWMVHEWSHCRSWMDIHRMRIIIHEWVHRRSRLVNVIYEWVHRHSRMVNHTVIYEWEHRHSWRWATSRAYHLRLISSHMNVSDDSFHHIWMWRMRTSPFMTMNDVSWISFTDEYIDIHDDDSHRHLRMSHRHPQKSSETYRIHSLRRCSMAYHWDIQNTFSKEMFYGISTKSSPSAKVIKHWRMAMIVRYSRTSRVRDMSVRESSVCVPTIHLCVC